MIVATAQGFYAEVSSNKLLTFKAILVGWGANDNTTGRHSLGRR